MATAKKAVEVYTTKLARDLEIGDRFRTSEQDVWQEVVSLERAESDFVEEDLVTHKGIVSCETKVEGVFEKFRFTSFANIEVQILNA